MGSRVVALKRGLGNVPRPGTGLTVIFRKPHIVPDRRVVALRLPGRYIIFMQESIGASSLLGALALSMVVFKPEWQTRIQLGPRSAVVSVAAILLLIGAIGFAGINYR